VEMDDQLADKGLQIVEKKEREKIAR
jgi:hypothetical protein